MTEPPVTAASAPAASGEENAIWVYAVVPGDAAAPAATVGVAGEPVRTVHAAGFAAVVGSVPGSELRQERLNQRLRDAEWVEYAVRTHHRVVAACFRYVPTVPFRLATVYHGEDRVVGLLRDRSPALRAALELVSGRAEWGVQAYVAAASDPGGRDPAPGPATPTGPAVSTGPATPPGPDGPGAGYLRRRQAERARQQRARAAARAAAAQADAALRELAVAGHRSPLRADSGEDPTRMVLNSAYLVDDERADEFTGGLRKLAENLPGLRFRLTGPWPAYSFVELGGDGS